MRKPSRGEARSEGEMVQAPGLTLQATSSVAREDRDGLLPLQGI